jgi:uncharacterized protein
LSDGYPILILSEASNSILNEKSLENIDIHRFRPNIILTDCEAFTEDNLNKFTINEAEFYAVKPCARCQITTLNVETLKFGKEPLLSLSKFRKFGNKIVFGENVVVHKIGHIKVGDVLN